MKLVEAQEGRRVLDRLFGYEMSLVALPPGRRRRRRPAGSRASPPASSSSGSGTAWRSASATYWDLDGDVRDAERRRDRSRRRSPRSTGKRLASGPRLRRRRPARSSAGADVALLDEDDAAALAARLDDAAFTVASVESRTVTERPTAAVHHVDAPAGGGAQARLQRGAHDVRRAGALRARATSPTCAPTPRTLSDQAIDAARGQIRRCTATSTCPTEPRDVPQQGEERAGGARGDPARGRSHAHPRRPRARAAGRRRAPPLRPHLEAHGRVARWPTRGSGASPLRLAATSTAGEEAMFQATGRTIEFPGYLRAYVEGADDPDAELEDREAILPPLAEGDARRRAASCARRATPRSRRRATPRRAW